MSREIKFRAWNQQANSMITWDGIEASKILALDEGLNHSDFIVLPKCYELMQYTGLKDRNGVEIYEGDIVETRDGSHEIYEIDFSDGMFCANSSSIDWALYSVFDEVVVIGNIHENPEMLK